MTPRTVRSVCPHDCPSTCPLEVELLDERTIGRVRGVAGHPYSAGVVCAKVARYAERVHHPERLQAPLRRTGPKGSGRFREIGWDDALDEVATALRAAAAEHGPEAVWPYVSAGTMGLVQRDGMERLRNEMGWSRQARTICSTIARAGWSAGYGAVRGTDAREMAESDLVVLWGINALHSQIHVAEWARRARTERGAKIVVVDPYRNPTAAMADLHLAVRPGTDGALACAVMHVLFKEGFADREYLADHAADADGLERHLATRTPAWAAAITGLAEEDIVGFARLYGATKKSFIRLGFGFSRSRNGAVNVHAVGCLPVVTGAWRHRGGGALFLQGDVYGLDRTLIEGRDAARAGVRELDSAQIGRILTGNVEALRNGPPVTAVLVQNSNPAVIAPESGLVRRGLEREDLFLCVHEQFLTETALMADIVLPATTFLEHADIYLAGGHTFLQVAKPVIAPFAQARSNHEVVAALAARLGATHRGFAMDAWEIIEETLRASGRPEADSVLAAGGHDCALPFETAHYLDGFGHTGGRFRFAPEWPAGLPRFPDHLETIEAADGEHPFRLITPPARHFLNTSFTETPTAQKSERRPTVRLHPDDCAALGIAAGDLVRLGNRRGEVLVHAVAAEGQARGVAVVESVWPNRDFEGGAGINCLTGADPVPPNGGIAYHDIAVWVRPA